MGVGPLARAEHSHGGLTSVAETLAPLVRAFAAEEARGPAGSRGWLTIAVVKRACALFLARVRTMEVDMAVTRALARGGGAQGRGSRWGGEEREVRREEFLEELGAVLAAARG